MNENIKINTGQILLSLRKSKGYSQADVAEYLGITTAAYQNYEAGRREANYNNIIKLAEYYNVTTDYLLGRQNSNPPSDPIEEFADKKSLKDLEEILIREYLELSDKQRDAVLNFMRKCIAEEEARKQAKISMSVPKQSKEPEKVEEKKEIDEETLKIMRETEEKKLKALSALESIDDEYETIIIETTPEKIRADLNRAEEEQRNSQKDVS